MADARVRAESDQSDAACVRVLVDLLMQSEAAKSPKAAAESAEDSETVDDAKKRSSKSKTAESKSPSSAPASAAPAAAAPNPTSLRELFTELCPGCPAPVRVSLLSMFDFFQELTAGNLEWL